MQWSIDSVIKRIQMHSKAWEEGEPERPHIRWLMNYIWLALYLISLKAKFLTSISLKEKAMNCSHTELAFSDSFADVPDLKFFELNLLCYYFYFYILVFVYGQYTEGRNILILYWFVSCIFACVIIMFLPRNPFDPNLYISTMLSGYGIKPFRILDEV